MRRRSLGRLALGALLLPLAGAPTAARAEGVEVLALQVERGPTIVALDFALRVTLPAAVEDALRRGVPLHFVARAALYRSRWYWRDERIGRATRQWRLSYQPLTNSYRVSIGGLHQSVGSLDEALTTVTRLSSWRLAAGPGWWRSSRSPGSGWCSASWCRSSPARVAPTSGTSSGCSGSTPPSRRCSRS
ncbi:MAG: DUF4390 domain-containing protein [Burkholderiaceae bacterium]|nr:DUF4390 domain-containing protein [Burkholderiaceae bacterium]